MAQAVRGLCVAAPVRLSNLRTRAPQSSACAAVTLWPFVVTPVIKCTFFQSWRWCQRSLSRVWLWSPYRQRIPPCLLLAHVLSSVQGATNKDVHVPHKLSRLMHFSSFFFFSPSPRETKIRFAFRQTCHLKSEQRNFFFSSSSRDIQKRRYKRKLFSEGTILLFIHGSRA